MAPRRSTSPLLVLEYHAIEYIHCRQESKESPSIYLRKKNTLDSSVLMTMRMPSFAIAVVVWNGVGSRCLVLWDKHIGEASVAWMTRF